ncbi:MAG TPA: tRNA pseudouridine(55) synthase TruB [Candidatus Limnocylindrales bacterium]|nr:tRNA pseudouridine(55) synthase TruB [Candidatus Limnocylindrales bacterium]
MAGAGSRDGSGAPRAASGAIRLDGILVVDKPAGPTSHDIVGLVRRLSGMKRVGHGGTLDPFARGVLPIFLGRATRVVEYHLGDRKQYRATVCFGASSTTDDLEGELTPVPRAPSGAVLARADVEAALAAFRGPIVQVPPAYSAIKVAGRRAYALARAGQQPELSPRSVEIDRIELLEWDDSDPQRPIAVIEVDCSAGTYIRAIARDVGAALGTGAYLGALSRTASGPFRLADAIALDPVRAAVEAGPAALARLLLPIDAGLSLPSIQLTDDELKAVVRGQFIRPSAESSGPASELPVRLLAPGGELAGFGRWDGTRVMPDKVLVDA